MKTRYIALVAVLMSGASIAATIAFDPRCCIIPIRNVDGSIYRSGKAYRDFRSIWPCPATGSRAGACPGWSVDHIIPLACGGTDEVQNMQWLPNSIKSGKAPDNKDRWERRVYCQPNT